MEDAGQIAIWALAFRVGERIILSFVVILVSLVVTVGFWRSIQRVDFQLGKDKLSGAANVVLATPVFALLALIGFAWVSFSHPVSFSVPGATADADVADAGGGFSFTGAMGEAPEARDDGGFERRRREGIVASLNCIAAAAGPAVSPRDADALAEARLAVLAPVWADDWGDADAFRAWALGRSAGPPDPEAQAAFAAAHPEC